MSLRAACPRGPPVLVVSSRLEAHASGLTLRRLPTLDARGYRHAVGFGIRIMPGVRLSASSRGVRMGLGPRVARVHVGSGRPTISTGVGSATVWAGIGPGSRRRSRSSRARPSIESYGATPRQAELAAQIGHLIEMEAALVSVHKAAFEASVRVIAEPAAPVDEAAIYHRVEHDALEGIPIYALGERRAVKKNVAQFAEVKIRAERDAREAAHAREQAHLDEEWRLLTTNDPATVLQALEDAFEDNQAPAVPIDVTGDAVSIVMTYANASAIPDRKPAVTPTGRPTLQNRTKTERNALYAEIIASNVLATVRETLAVAPAINTVTVLTIEKTVAVGGVTMLSALAATGFARVEVDGFEWERLEPRATLALASPCLLNPKGRTAELAPLDLSHEPEIAAVLGACVAMLDARIDPRVRMPATHEPVAPAPEAHAPTNSAASTCVECGARAAVGRGVLPSVWHEARTASDRIDPKLRY